ncbi:MAG: gluconate 2-dehydrogenase subunit 3 family protein [Gemmatimonadetes bacterium]|nr:gluconate 2-dehydrogenase subunit 3 family protein [Gemmatimonadota bacterium]
MGRESRRTFLKQSASALTAVALTRCAPEEVAQARASLDPEMLRAVGRAVLPSELGADGIERAVTAFERWLAEYEPVAEADHDYGGSEIEYTPPDPAPGWAAQLEALDLEAQRRHEKRFLELSPEQQRDLIRRQLERDPPGRLGNAMDARHVAVALMAHYYASPEATDRCYGAQVGPLTCRDLGRAPEEPAPLALGD